MFQQISRATIVGLARLISGVRVEWHDDLSPEPVPRIFFANHGSHLDFIVVWSALPTAIRKRTRVIAAGDYWGKSRLRRYLATTVFNAVLVDRTKFGRDSNPVEAFAEVLAQGDSMIIFPEGTRSVDGSIADFKPGLFHIAKRHPDIPLVPIYLENLNRILPKGEFLPVPLISRCRFGGPHLRSPDESKPDFLARMRQELLQLTSTEPPAP